jgi:hypothetical protein
MRVHQESMPQKFDSALLTADMGVPLLNTFTNTGYVTDGGTVQIKALNRNLAEGAF